MAVSLTGGTSLARTSGTKLGDTALLLGHVRDWEVTEGRMLRSWKQFVVRCLPWVVAGLSEDLLEVVLVDHAAGVVCDSSLHNFV